MQNFIKDPDATLDFHFDWSSWLAGGETISSHQITVDSGINKDSSSDTDDTVTVWLSGGSTGVGYKVACKITTSNSRVDERSIVVSVLER